MSQRTRWLSKDRCASTISWDLKTPWTKAGGALKSGGRSFKPAEESCESSKIGLGRFCDAFTHPLVVVKSHPGFSCFFGDFSDKGLTDVALFDIPPRTWHQFAEPACPTRRVGIAHDDAGAENLFPRKIHRWDRCFFQAHDAGIFDPAARVGTGRRYQAEL